ncbi:MAG: GNAT family N-acetyltransferase [Anaerolineae bacterium]
MIKLRPITQLEFPNYSKLFIADYAAEIESNYRYSAEKSRAQAQQELKNDLPQGIKTPNQFLCCLDKKEAGTVGYLWYTLYDHGKTAFILDFILLERFRGLGLGKESLVALEAKLEPTGVEQIKLRVAGDNKRAFKLYERMGFSITGINMIKHLSNNNG